MEIKKVRDCIAHSGGRPDKGMVQKLKSYNFDGMRLPDGYFGESAHPPSVGVTFNMRSFVNRKNSLVYSLFHPVSCGSAKPGGPPKRVVN